MRRRRGNNNNRNEKEEEEERRGGGGGGEKGKQKNFITRKPIKKTNVLPFSQSTFCS